MTQTTVDFSGNPTGKELMDDYLAKMQENVLTANSGISRPDYAVAGTEWLDNSVTPWQLKRFDGTQDIVIGTFDPSTHEFVVSDSTKQEKLVSGTNIKTINGGSILGAGDIKTVSDVDGETVVINSDEQLQAVGVIDTGTTTARKFWSGTQKEYNEQIKVPDANTQYDITDDFTALPAGHDTLPLPLGMIIPAVGFITDAKYHLLDGTTIAKDGMYSAFCEEVQKQVDAGRWFACTEDEFNSDVENYEQCGRFVIGDDYVRLPKITRYIGATISLSEIGKAFGESLPNIKGHEPVSCGSYASSSDGALVYTKGGLGVSTTSSSYYNANGQLDFDASLSSSTYQDGAKVNPENVKYPYYMVISTTGQTTAVEIDVNKVAEDLSNVSNSCANLDLSNISNSGKATVTGIIMPDYTAGVSRTAGTYTESVDGVLIFDCSSSSSGYATIDVTVGDETFYFYQGYTNVDNPHLGNGFLHLPKNTSYTLSNITGLARCRWFPLKGVNNA